ncbi:MAG: helix-turn-helix domain-containing protein [Gemmataceae bacterium]
MPAPEPPAASHWGAFVALPENRSALVAVRSLARHGRLRANPLLLHGPPGAGKSHLLNELLQKLADREPVVTARRLAAGDIARSEAPFADRDLVRCDLLVLEDVHLLPAKDADALCEVLDRRLARKRATIFTANVGPAVLRHIPRRFTSRLAAGLAVQLEPLGAASRRTLLAWLAKKRKLHLTDDALDWLATQSSGGGVRPLVGLLENLMPGPLPLDAAQVRRMLLAAGRAPAGRTDVNRVVKHVAAAFDISQKELLGGSRLKRVMWPRQVAMFLAREVCGLSLPRLGAAFGRDHTTILHACRKVEAEAARDAVLAGRLRQLHAELM